MLTTTNFDDQFTLYASKINDVCTQRLLSFEFESIQTMGSKVVPEALFGLGGCRSQTFGPIK